MDLYQPICRHIVIPLHALWEKTPYLKHLAYLESSQYFTEEKLAALQWEKIKNLLDHAYANSPFYKRSFDVAGIHPDDIRTWNDYLSVPVQKKSDVIRAKDDIFAPNVDKYYRFLTTGSTGKPLTGYWNKTCANFKRACALRSSLWSGYELGGRVYCLYGNPEIEKRGLLKFRSILRRRIVNRTEILDMLQMSERSMLEFADKMRKRPPSLLWGHAHGLYTLAKFLDKRGITDIRPKGIFSAGMVLHKWEREQVEKVFDTIFQDRYGCEELGLIATECQKREGLHINMDAHHVEVLNKQGDPVEPGEAGQIVITDLNNRVMPFIRYKLEDIVTLSPDKCSCGRTQPMIEKIEGRVADFLIRPDNKLVSGISLTDHFAVHMPGVSQIQIVQKEIDCITLRIVKDSGFNAESKKTISNLVKELFGEKMRHEYEYVTEIEKGARGKFRFTICEVEHDLL
jgi:phenylacetate-coenzyme A ligase PaaK-like adenylate-forming protein